MNDAIDSRPKELHANDSISVQHEGPWMRRASFDLVFAFGVEHAEFLDNFAVRIGQEWKRDFVFFGKLSQGSYGIVANCNHLNAGAFDLVQIGLQFDQLLLAVRSPPDRTMKDDGNLARL